MSLEDQLSPGTLELAAHPLVESRMDLSLVDEKFKNNKTGRLVYNHKILLKIDLFSYSRGLTGSRQIEQTWREKLVFMALTCGQNSSHSTIVAFTPSMKAEIVPLFRHVLFANINKPPEMELDAYILDRYDRRRGGNMKYKNGIGPRGRSST